MSFVSVQFVKDTDICLANLFSVLVHLQEAQADG